MAKAGNNKMGFSAGVGRETSICMNLFPHKPPELRENLIGNHGNAGGTSNLSITSYYQTTELKGALANEDFAITLKWTI